MSEKGGGGEEGGKEEPDASEARLWWPGRCAEPFATRRWEGERCLFAPLGVIGDED